MDFIDAIKKRRTIYALNNKIDISDKEIQDILELTLDYVPSAFNSRSARFVLLLHDNHTKLWDIVKSTLRKIVPPEHFHKTEKKIDDCFSSGYGTVLFFEDQDVVADMQKQFPTYKDYFPEYSLESAGMHQYVVWTLFAEKNVGASLQHYQPIIDDEVASTWGIPKSWKLLAQMPFGGIIEGAGEKPLGDMPAVLRVFK